MLVLTNIDLNRNQLINAVLHNLAPDPATPAEGQIYRDTTNHLTKVYGAAAWETLSISTHTHAYIPLATVTERGDIIFASGAGAVSPLAHGAAGYLLATGGDGADPSWAAPYAHPTTNGNIHIPASGATTQLLQWDSAGTAKWITVSSDIAIADAGAVTIATAAVTLAKMANLAASTFIARKTASTGVPEAVSAADVDVLLGVKALATKGDLLTFSTVPALLGIGTNAYVLTADSNEATGMKWVALAAGHTQNTDTGTTGTTFILDSGGTPLKIKSASGAFSLRNGADNANADLTVKDLTCDVLTVNTTVTIEAETVTIHDNIILLDENAATAGASSGIQIERGSTGADASLLWVEADACFKYGLAAGEIKVARVVTADVGDNNATSIDVIHNLGTRDVICQLVTKASTYDAVMTDWVAKDANTVTFIFAVKPTSAQYRAIITG
jgi:hypothetical protein